MFKTKTSDPKHLGSLGMADSKFEGVSESKSQFQSTHDYLREGNITMIQPKPKDSSYRFVLSSYAVEI